MSDSEIKAIALFFFFTTLDESTSVSYASEALDICIKKLEKNNKLNPRVILVAACMKVWKKNRKKIIRGRPQYSLDSGWILNKSSDMSAWKEFQKRAPEEELLSVVFSKIINFNDEELSLGIGTSQGTLRFRVGRGLKKLGIFLKQGTTQLSVVRS